MLDFASLVEIFFPNGHSTEALTVGRSGKRHRVAGEILWEAISHTDDTERGIPGVLFR